MEKEVECEELQRKLVRAEKELSMLQDFQQLKESMSNFEEEEDLDLEENL